jgi:hypothetical protein
MSFKFRSLKIKDGMVLETRNKERYLLCGDRLMSVNDKLISIALSSYNKDLLLSDNGVECEGDIVKIYAPVECLSQVNSTTDLIWQRDVNVNYTKYVTIDDLEKLFGYRLRIVEE